MRQAKQKLSAGVKKVYSARYMWPYVQYLIYKVECVFIVNSHRWFMHHVLCLLSKYRN
jgi:hypothetical protein